MQKPVSVGLSIIGAQPGDPAIEEIARFDTIQAAEDFLSIIALIDPERLDAGDYSIDAPEEMVNPSPLFDKPQEDKDARIKMLEAALADAIGYVQGSIGSSYCDTGADDMAFLHELEDTLGVERTSKNAFY